MTNQLSAPQTKVVESGRLRYLCAASVIIFGPIGDKHEVIFCKLGYSVIAEILSNTFLYSLHNSALNTAHHL